MKKIIALLLSIVCVFSLMACSGGSHEISRDEWLRRAQNFEEHNYSKVEVTVKYAETEYCEGEKHKSNETGKEEYVFSDVTQSWEPAIEGEEDYYNMPGTKALGVYYGEEFDSIEYYDEYGEVTYYDDMSVKIHIRYEDGDDSEDVNLTLRFDKYGYYIYAEMVEDYFYAETDEHYESSGHVVNTVTMKYK
jgi:hypothetical protein